MVTLSNLDIAEHLLKNGEDSFRKGEVNEAIKYFTDAIALNKHLASAYCDLAVALWENNDNENAIINMGIALEKDSNNLIYNLNYAKMCSSVGDYRKAFELFDNIKKYFINNLSPDEILDIDENMNNIKELLETEALDLSENPIISKPLNDVTIEQSFDEEFYSCQYIEGALLFGPSYLSICCVPHTDSNHGNVWISEYHGGELPIRKIIEKREQLRRDNQLEIDTPCKGCSFLRKSKWGKSQFLFEMLTVAHYSICNLRCSYCNTMKISEEERNRDAVQSYDLLPIFSKMIDDRIISPHSTIEWGGGEPTMFKEFNSIINKALDYGMNIALLSNCSIKSDVIKKGLKSNQLTICCSIDCGTPEKYLEIKGKNLYYKVWDNIAELNRINPNKISIKYIFMDENFDISEITEFIKMCKKHNLKNLTISRDINSYRGSQSESKKDFTAEMYESIAEMGFQALNTGMCLGFWPAFEKKELNNIKLRIIRKLLTLTDKTSIEHAKSLVNQLVP